MHVIFGFFFTLIFILLILRFLFRILIPIFLRLFFKRVSRGNNSETDEDEEANLSYGARKRRKGESLSDKLGGEYVDFEEVKPE